MRNYDSNWSKKYDSCTQCHTISIPYLGKGLCRSCYWKSPKGKLLKAISRKRYNNSKKGKTVRKNYYNRNKEKFKSYSKEYGKKYRAIPKHKKNAQIYAKHLYENNRERLIKEQNERILRVKTENTLKLIEYFKQYPCIDCGEKDPIVLHFDHKKGNKSFGIADSMGLKWETVFKEIKKCDVVCANCHMRRTANTQNWLKVRLLKKLV